MTQISVEQDAWRCDVCGGTCTAYRGFIVCVDCGLVIEQLLVTSSYIMTRDTDRHSPTQAVYNSKLPIIEHGMGSDLFSCKDGKQQPLPPTTRVRMYRLRRLNRRADDPRLRKALLRLSRACGILVISRSIHERAATILRRTLRKWTRPRHCELGVIALLHAVRERRLPLTRDEILASFQICFSEQLLSEAQFLVNKTFGPVEVSAIVFLPRIISALRGYPGIDARLKQHQVDMDAYFAALELRSRDLLRHNSTGSRRKHTLAAAAVYSCSLTLEPRGILTHTNVAEATGFAFGTIRDQAQFLNKIIGGDETDE